MKIPSNITTKLIVMFFILTSCILAGAYFVYKGYEKDRLTEVEHILSSIAELKASQLVLWREERLGDAQIMYGNVAFTNLVRRYFKNPQDVEAKQHLQNWMAQYPQSAEYDQVRLIDTQGITRISIPARLSMSRDVSKEVQETFQTGKIQLVDFYRNEKDQRTYLGLIVPILDATAGKIVIGVMHLRINPEKNLYPYILHWPTPSLTAETLLVRRDGNDVLYLHNLKFSKDAALKLRISLQKTNVPSVMAVLGRIGIVKGIDYRNIPVIADVRPVKDSPWFLVTRIDLSEMEAPVREQFWLLVGFVLALIFATAAGLILLWRQQSIRFYQEQLRSAKALRESEDRFKKLFTEAPLGIALKDSLTGRIYEVNSMFAKIVGRKIDEVMQLNWMSITHPDDIQEEREHVAQLNAGEIHSFRMEKRYLHPDGSLAWINMTIASVKDQTHEHPCHLCMIEDITERRQQKMEIQRLNTELEQRVIDRTTQLQSANKELESFCYSVSHDLRAPLRHIDGYVDLLTTRCRDGLSDQGLHYLDTISDSARQMGILIDDLLQFSRTGRAEMKQEKVDMNKLFKEVQTTLKETYVGRNVEWIVADLPAVRGDYSLLRQVWANLLSNALKFTRTKEVARIEISVHREKEEFIFVVSDNGVGFEMRYATKLFGVFQRLHPVEKFEGTGIGLATVQRIIDRHGGRVWAEAEVDQGARFYFALPIFKEE